MATWFILGVNSGLLAEGPATNRLRGGTADACEQLQWYYIKAEYMNHITFHRGFKQIHFSAVHALRQFAVVT